MDESPSSAAPDQPIAYCFGCLLPILPGEAFKVLDSENLDKRRGISPHFFHDTPICLPRRPLQARRGLINPSEETSGDEDLL